ncbi:MAG: cytochrome P450 [Moorea sp. SIO2B7]|nr:cytochrome P450 [Moorena sp. SIO2B7]
MELINGPKTPSWLQKLQWITNPIGYMDSAAKNYGELFNGTVIGNYDPLLLVSNPQALQQIFTSDTKQFSAPANNLLQLILGNHSIFMLEGDRHRRERKLLMSPFHGDRMRAYGELICDITEQFFSQLTSGKTFYARDTVQDISMGVILNAVFGIDDLKRFHRLKQLMVSLMDSLQSPLTLGLLYFPFLRRDLGVWSPWSNFRRLQQQIDDLIYAEIKERRQQDNSSNTDILTLLMSARDEVGETMTDTELHDELLTLLFAGYETTSNAIIWALYWIHYLPEVREKLIKELDSLGEKPEPMSIFQLPYLSAVCNESLRIYPVALLTVPRAVKQPVNLMGYKLEPGTRLYGCIYLTHQREDLYPEPKKFKPERFLERKFSPYEFMPFGGGVRRCLGEALAMFEMKLVLATILSHYELALAYQRPVKPQRRGVNLTPAGGLKMVMKEKRKTV